LAHRIGSTTTSITQGEDVQHVTEGYFTAHVDVTIGIGEVSIGKDRQYVTKSYITVTVYITTKPAVTTPVGRLT
jgi:hypothetical protein